jgi:hypothetical protein
MKIEELISQKINKQHDLEAIRPLIEEVKSNNWGVGHDQLLKSLILLSEGSVEKMHSFFPIVDPRDLIMDAQDNYPDYF